LKAAGYNELPGGQKEAMVTFNDDLVVVHEGDVIGSKYKVVKISPAMVVVEDGDTQKTIELPFPQ
jgi:ribosomal protein L24